MLQDLEVREGVTPTREKGVGQGAHGGGGLDGIVSALFLQEPARRAKK